MQKTSLKYVGPRPYKSTDHVTGETVSVAAGDVVALSNEKASQVLRDFPANWQPFGPLSSIAPATPPAQTAHAPIVSPEAPVVPPAPPSVPAAPTPAPAPARAPKPAPRKKPGRR